MIKWLINISACLSQLLNTVIFNGNPDQTISARCYVNKHKAGWRQGYNIINAVFFWQVDHCYSSHSYDIQNARMTLNITSK